MTRNRLSIYVSSPDSYSDVFSVFYRAFFRYWKDCPYDFYLTTNTQAYEDIKCIQNNKPGDTWVERTLAAMPKIDSKYLLLMCDDTFISQPVNNIDIERILDYMDNNNIKYCRIKPIKAKDIIGKEIGLCHVSTNIPYAVNLQIGIIRKDFLMHLLGDGKKSAWEIEGNIQNKLKVDKYNNYVDIVAVNKPIVSFVHGIWKGKWIRGTYNYIKKEYPDYVFERPRLSIGLSIKILLINNLEMMTPIKARRALKSILTKLGVKFTTTT